MRTYPELFRIAFEHAYHAGTAFDDWQMKPAAATWRLMQACGVVVRREQGALSFLVSPEGIPRLRGAIAEANSDVTFVLGIFPTDPHFSLYSAPAVPPGQCLLAGTGAGAGTRNGEVPVTDEHMLHPGPVLDARSLVDAAHPACAALLAAAAPRQPAVVVRIGLDSTVLNEAPRCYVVRFGAASSVWKYLLLGALARRDVTIADLDGAVRFVPGGEEACAGGNAKSFVSDRPIALSRRPRQRFQLREDGPFGERILVKSMPAARPGVRQVVVMDGQAVQVSEIFINP